MNIQSNDDVKIANKNVFVWFFKQQLDEFNIY